MPQSVFTQMSALNDATQFFNNNVAPIYQEALLASYQSNMCPILTQVASWILTHPVAAMPTTNYLLTDSGIHLTSDSGQRLTKA